MSPFTVLGLSGGRDQTQRKASMGQAEPSLLCQVFSVRHPVLPVFDLSPVSSPVCSTALGSCRPPYKASGSQVFPPESVGCTSIIFPATIGQAGFRQSGPTLPSYILRAQRSAVGTFELRPDKCRSKLTFPQCAPRSSLCFPGFGKKATTESVLAKFISVYRRQT